MRAVLRDPRASPRRIPAPRVRTPDPAGHRHERTCIRLDPADQLAVRQPDATDPGFAQGSCRRQSCRFARADARSRAGGYAAGVRRREESARLRCTTRPARTPIRTAHIDLVAGLPPLRARWIAERGDTEALPGPSSEFGRRRAADPKLAAVRFPHAGKPRRAKAGANVTQMHYARRGIVTPEMEFIAIRENQRIEALRELGACCSSIPARASARQSRSRSRRSSCATRSRAAARSSRATSTIPKPSR